MGPSGAKTRYFLLFPHLKHAEESERFFALRARYGTTYRRDTSFRVMEFFDKNMKDLYLHRLLDTRTRSAKVDEASCERDFSMSGRIFGPLRERMATDVGEKLVSIPLMAASTPVTVDHRVQTRGPVSKPSIRLR